MFFIFWDISGVHFDGDNKCGDSPLWHKWYPRTQVAFNALFMVIFLSLICPFFIARKRSAKARAILQWYSYAPALFFMFLYFLLNIIDQSLFYCFQSNAIKTSKLSVAVDVFGRIANVLILGVILLSVTCHLRKHANLETGLVNWVHYGLMGLVSCFLIVDLVIFNYNTVNTFTGKHDTVDDDQGVGATYEALYLLAALVAVGHISAAFYKLRNNSIAASREGLNIWVPALVFFLFAFALTDATHVFGWRVGDKKYTQGAEITFLILTLIWQAMMYVSVIYVSMAKGWETSATGQQVEEHNEETALQPEMAHQQA